MLTHHQWLLGLLPRLGYMDNVAMSMWKQVAPRLSALSPLGCIPRSRIAGSHCNSLWGFWWTLQTVFHSTAPPLPIPTSSAQCSIIRTLFSRVFDSCPPKGCEVLVVFKEYKLLKHGAFSPQTVRVVTGNCLPTGPGSQRIPLKLLSNPHQPLLIALR